MTPITRSQLDASRALYSLLTRWREADDCLYRLGRSLPTFDGPSTLAKVVAVNSLYGTNVFAVQEMARCITSYFADPKTVEHDLIPVVEELANLTHRKTYSFASKFCHFFLSGHLPILDSKAAISIARHLGPAGKRQKSCKRYVEYVQDYQQLIDISSEIAGSTPKHIDEYLWLSCLESEFRDGRRINLEVAELFGSYASRNMRAELLPAL